MTATIEEIKTYADAWLVQMQQAITEAKLSFTVPHRSDNEEMTEVVFEWWSSQNDKKLTVYIAEDEEKPGSITSEYIRLWGGVNGPMYDGSAELPDIFRLLWQWLWS